MKQNTVEPNLNSTLDSKLQAAQKIAQESTTVIPSELEKEWAWFFDRLGIEWKYVPAKSAFFLPALSTATINPLSEHARRYHVVSHQSFYLQVKEETPSQGEVADFIRLIPDDNGYIAIGSPSDIKDTPALRLGIPGNLYIRSQIVKLARYWYFGECGNCQRVQLYSVAHKTCSFCKEEAVHCGEHLKMAIEAAKNISASHESCFSAGESAGNPADNLADNPAVKPTSKPAGTPAGKQAGTLANSDHERDEIVPISVAARMLGIRCSLIYLWIRKGRLPKKYEQSMYVVSIAQVRALQDKVRSGTKSPLKPVNDIVPQATLTNWHSSSSANQCSSTLADQRSSTPTSAAIKLTVNQDHYEGVLIRIGQLENKNSQLVRLNKRKDQDLSKVERLLFAKSKAIKEADQRIRELEAEIEKLKGKGTTSWWKKLWGEKPLGEDHYHEASGARP